MNKILFSIFIVLLSCVPCRATTYYVSTTGNDANSCATAQSGGASAKLTIGAGISCLAQDDTLLVQDGTYSGVPNFINDRNTDIPAGSGGSFGSRNYTTIQAENRFGARIVDTGTATYYDALIYLRDTYTHVDGFILEVQNNGTLYEIATIEGNYNYVSNIIMKRSGAADDYGSWVNASGSYNLIEDCAGVGHCRYGFFTGGPTSTAQYNIFRRCVGRFDYSDSNQPMATFSFYGNNSGTGTNNHAFQNCIAIDGQQADTGAGLYAYVWGGFYFPKNAYQSWIQGSVVLNVDAEYGGYAPIEQAGGELNIVNSVTWDTKDSRSSDPSGINLRGTGDGVYIDHVTIGAETAAWSDSHSGNTRTLENTLYWLNTGVGTMVPWDTEDDNAFNPAEQARGTNSSTASGLLYLTRIETGSAMDGAANDGGDIGATVLYAYGGTGRIWGDDGWNTEDVQSLWPWTNEDTIKTIFSESNDPPEGAAPVTNDTTRGFTTGTAMDGNPQTLTKYIWEYLGNQIPCDVYGTCDETAPAVTISQSDPTTVQAATVTLTGTATDAVGVSSCKWRSGSAPDGNNGTACSGSTSWSCNVTGLSMGDNTVYVGCSDPSGNWGSDSLTVTREAAAAVAGPISGGTISGGMIQ